MSNNDDLKKYKKAIKILADNKQNDVFTNGGDEYAIIVLNSLFTHATNCVSIFAETLTSNLSSNKSYLTPLLEFIENEEHTLNIIISRYPTIAEYKDSTLETLVKLSKANRNISIKVLGYVWDDLSSFSTVVDDKMFHFEYDTEKKEAHACFNNPTLSKRLSDTHAVFRKKANDFDLINIK